MPLPNAPANPEAFHQFLDTATETLQLDERDRVLIESVGAPVMAEWAVSTLSGGEISYRYRSQDLGRVLPTEVVPLLAELVDDRRAAMFDYRAGTLAERVDELYDSVDPAKNNRHLRFSKAIAALVMDVDDTNHDNLQWNIGVNIGPQTAIVPDMKGDLNIQFDTRRGVFRRRPLKIPIEGPIESVTTFGPGLSGRYLAAALVGHANEVTFVSGGRGAEFINTWNELSLRRIAANIQSYRDAGKLQDQLPLGVHEDTAYVPSASYYADGISSAKDYLPFADAVIMSAVHSAGPEECIDGVDAASETLNNGGYLIIKAPKVSLDGEGGMDVLMPHAKELFGEPIASGRCGKLSQHSDLDKPLRRPASFAVFRR